MKLFWLCVFTHWQSFVYNTAYFHSRMAHPPITIDAEAVMALRAMTPEQRLAKAFDRMYISRLLLFAATKRQHPDLSEEEVRQHIVKQILEQ